MKRTKNIESTVVRRDDVEEGGQKWKVDEDGCLYLDLKQNGTRRVTIRKYSGVVGVDIREFYEDKKSGKMKPGRKGIYLTKEQYETLKENVPLIDKEVESLQG